MFLESFLVMNIRHYGALRGQQKIVALNKKMFETRVLVPTNSFVKQSHLTYKLNSLFMGPTWR